MWYLFQGNNSHKIFRQPNHFYNLYKKPKISQLGQIHVSSPGRNTYLVKADSYS